MKSSVGWRRTSRCSAALGGLAVIVLTSTMAASAAVAGTAGDPAPSDEHVQPATEAAVEGAAVDQPAATDVAAPEPVQAAPVPAEVAVSPAVQDADPLSTEALLPRDVVGPVPAAPVPGDAAPAEGTELAHTDVVLAAAPAAVAGVSAHTDYTLGTLEVDWVVTDPVDASVTAYLVTIDGTSYSTQAPASARHVTFGELTLAAGTYDVSVVARNPDGDSAATTAQDVAVAALAPSAPRDLAASETTPGDVTFTWGTPTGSGTSDLDLYVMSLERPGGDPVIFNLGPQATEATVWLDAATYTVRLRARNQEYLWGPPSEISYTVVPAPPTAPRDVEVSQFQYTPGDIDVAWTEPALAGTSNITRYTVTLTGAGLVLTQDIGAVGNNRTTFPDLPAGTYTATVTATNLEDLTSPAGTSQPIEVLAVAPSAPEAVEVHVDGPREVSVSWQPPTDTGTSAVDYYEVYLLHGYSGTRTPVQRFTGTDGASFTGLRYGTYYAHVYAVNHDGLTGEDGVSAWFDVERVAPTTPRQVVAVLSDPTEITATWTAPVDPGTSDIARYVVTLTGTVDPAGAAGLAAASDLSTVVVPAGDPLTATFGGVAPGTYAVTVTATNLDGATSTVAASGTLTVAPAPTTPQGRAPSVPRNLVVSQTGPRQVTVRFDAVADPGDSPVTGYSIGVSSSTAAGGDLYPAATRSHVFDDVDPDTYQLAVRAFNGVGGGPFAEATVVVRADWTPPGLAPVVASPVSVPSAAPAVRASSTSGGPGVAAAPPVGTLARTGTDAGTTALGALVLVGLGATGLLATRRRRPC